MIVSLHQYTLVDWSTGVLNALQSADGAPPSRPTLLTDSAIANA